MTKAELYQKACMLPLLPGVYIIRDNGSLKGGIQADFSSFF